MSDVVTIPRKRCIAYDFRQFIAMTDSSASTAI